MVSEDIECDTCKRGNGIYAHCIQLSKEFGGACGNCKRGDRGARCTIRDIDGNTKLDRDEEIEMVERPKSRRAGLRIRKAIDGKERKYSA